VVGPSALDDAGQVLARIDATGELGGFARAVIDGALALLAGDAALARERLGEALAMGESLDGRRTMTMPALVCLFMGDFARARRIAAGAVARLRDDARLADLAGTLTLLAGVQVGARLVSEAATSVAEALVGSSSSRRWPRPSPTWLRRPRRPRPRPRWPSTRGCRAYGCGADDAALGRDRRKTACDGWRAAYTDARRA
jgi:hypothetical protein